MYIYIFCNLFNEEILALAGTDYMAAITEYEQDPDAIPIEAYELIDVLVEEEDPWAVDCDLGNPWEEDC